MERYWPRVMVGVLSAAAFNMNCSGDRFTGATASSGSGGKDASAGRSSGGKDARGGSKNEPVGDAGASPAEGGSDANSSAGDGNDGPGGAPGEAGTSGSSNNGGAGGSAGSGGTSGSGGTGGSAGTGGVLRSCKGLAHICGKDGAGDCCASAAIPAGTFNRSGEATHPATLSAFRMDLYEITVGRFRKFVAGYPANKPIAGSGKNPHNSADAGWQDEWNAEAHLPSDQAGLVDKLRCNADYQTWTDTAGANENRPLSCVSWYMAYAFCIWDGGRLPTEAEWNYAASGGDEQRKYPWSDPAFSSTVDESYASYYVDDTQMCRGDLVDGCTLADLIPVGSKANGAGRWGQADLGGNLWELVQDLRLEEYATGACDDCANLTTEGPVADYRVARGGSFNWKAPNMETASRWNGAHSDDSWGDVGARCVRAP